MKLNILSMIILLAIVVYVVSIFFISRLIIPYLGFRKTALPQKIPKDMERAIMQLKKKAKSKEAFLNIAYDYLGDRFEGGRFHTFINFFLMYADLEHVWRKKGFIQCTLHNNLLRIFLVRSGFFNDDEIRLRHTFLNFNIHQYAQVKIKGKWVDVDLSWKHAGVPLGRHGRLFG